MTSRREFLQIGITASAWPLAAQAARAGATGGAGALPLYKVLYDGRFADSVRFAGAAAGLGIQTHAFEGDMTSFWYEDLYHEWRKTPAAIAGMTAHGPLFCLERLAWDKGMRVVFRAEHAPGQTCVEHELSGPLDMLRRSVPLADAGGDWGAAMAEVVAHCPRGRAEISAARLSSDAPASTSLHAEALYTWVIAPATRGRA